MNEILADLIPGFLSGVALIVAIGAQNAFVLRQGIRSEHVLPIVLVCASADAVLIGVGILGLGALIQSEPRILIAARYGGAAFLIAYGIAAVRRTAQRHRLTVDASTSLSLGAAITISLTFTFLNPHVYLDTVILLGSLANQRGERGCWFFGMGAAIASFMWFFALGFGSRFLAPWFRKPVAWRVLDTLIALIMFSLGIGLLWS